MLQINPSLAEKKQHVQYTRLGTVSSRIRKSSNVGDEARGAHAL